MNGRFNLETTPNPPMHISKGASESKRKQKMPAKSKKARAKAARIKAAQAAQEGSDTMSYGGACSSDLLPLSVLVP